MPAITTSGDAFQAVSIDGVRYSHIVDPRTGLGVVGPTGVTVIAPTATQADALATTLSVLGPQEGLPMVEATPGAAARFVRLEDGKPAVTASAGLVSPEHPVFAEAHALTVARNG